MSWKLKLLGVLNVPGWVVVVPLLTAALLHPFVNFRDWPGGFLLDRPAQQAQLHPEPNDTQTAPPSHDRASGRTGRAGDAGRAAVPALVVPRLVAPVPAGNQIVNVPVAPAPRDTDTGTPG